MAIESIILFRNPSEFAPRGLNSISGKIVASILYSFLRKLEINNIVLAYKNPNKLVLISVLYTSYKIFSSFFSLTHKEPLAIFTKAFLYTLSINCSMVSDFSFIWDKVI